MIAPFTVILLQINFLITGVVVTEMVFAYPGFGRMILDACLFGDIATDRGGDPGRASASRWRRNSSATSATRSSTRGSGWHERARQIRPSPRLAAAGRQGAALACCGASPRSGTAHGGAGADPVLGRCWRCSRPMLPLPSAHRAGRDGAGRSDARRRRTGWAATSSGGDVLSRLIFGARTVLTVAPLSVAAAYGRRHPMGLAGRLSRRLGRHADQPRSRT